MRSIPILLLLWASAALGQTYPARPVKIMAGASPGGGIDIISRLLADKFAERFKQPFVVENRPGASNTLAADFTARAAPTAIPSWWPPIPGRPSRLTSSS